ncbi:Peptidase M16 middle/third domain [Trinorchestia longiramus]|nr:Peptidase M16 middle/third domain [Trinorchestia longiramus]
MPNAVLMDASRSADATRVRGNVLTLSVPVKGFSDKKEYRSIQLSNGLRALLISDHVRHGPPAAVVASSQGTDDEEESEEEDEEIDAENELNDEDELEDCEEEEEDDDEESSKRRSTTETREYKAAASLAVSYGSCEDPPELPGLDRFSQFFVEPLMMKNAMDRERNAVDSEFTMALPSDGNREQQLISSLAPAGHPAANFTWGNAASLSSRPDDEVHDTLHEYRKKYYSAQFMTLVVQSRHSLDEMERKIGEIFSKIPNNGMPFVNRNQYQFPFPPSAVNKIIYMEPMKAKHVVAATWFLPSMKGRYKTQPLRFLAHLIGHEGFGSLLSFYKQKNWAYSLECECEMGDFEDGSFCCHLKVTTELTDEGFPLINDVLFAMFQYLALMRTQLPSESLFKEYQQLAKLNFDFEVESDAMQNVECLSAAMLKFDSEDYLSGSTLLFDHDPKFIKETLDRLTPEAVNVVVRSKTLLFSNSEVCTEKWFGTKYIICDLNEDQRKRFNSAESTPNPQLHLPPPNIYIPNDYSLLPAPEKKPKYPSCVMFDPRSGSLYYLPDYKFELPIVEVRVQFRLEVRPSRLIDKFLSIMSLFLQCYRYQLMEPLYEATLAKYSYSIGYSHEGLILHLSGFTQHLERVLNVLMEHMLNFSSNFRDEHFHSLKSMECQKLYNEATKPGIMRKQLRLHVLLPQCHLSLHHLQLLQAITVEDVLSCSSDLLQNAQVNMLIQGNITESAACGIYKGILDKIPRTDDSVQRVDLPGYRLLNPGVTIVKVHSVNKADGNSAIVNYYQGNAGTLRDQVLSDFLLCAMEEQCFDTLRTREQLSYSVHCQGNESNGVIGLSISLTPQAEKFSLNHVDSRVEAFIEKFKTNLSEMTDSAFSTFKETVLQMKKIDDLNLGDEVARNWAEITRKEYIFDRLQRHIDIVHSVTKDDVLAFFLSFVDPDTADYRKLSVQVLGSVDHKKHKSPSIDELKTGGLSCIHFESEDAQGSTRCTKFCVSNYLEHVESMQVMPYHPIVPS